MLLPRLFLGVIAFASVGCSSSENDGSALGSGEGPAPFSSETSSGQTEGPGSAGSSAEPGVGVAGSGSSEGAPGDAVLPIDAPVSDMANTPVSMAPDAGQGVSEPLPGGPRPVTPSGGCGSQNPPRGAGSLTIRGIQADYFVTLPNGYSPDSPVPLVFGFHGRNRTHIQFQTVDASGIQTELGSRAIMVYMKSQGGPGWNFDAEVPPSIEFFDELYPLMLETYCVDTSSVFAVGHSSGGYFSIILACRYGSLLRGIGSIAGARQETTCTDQRVAGMFIHGATDTVVANAGGRLARDQLIARNGCQMSTTLGAVSPCVAYDGCAPGFPVQWCEHQEPEYFDNGVATNHGWPSFASRAVNQFFQSLP
jgi:polyhydroxybutyrate depolymerase